MKKLRKMINKWQKKKNKLVVNIKWEKRFKNLSKKYKEILEENERLRECLDKDKNIKEINNLKSYITTLKRQRDILRLEAKK